MTVRAIPGTILVILACLGAFAQKGPTHVLGAKKTTVVPETFLRGFDPITVFFARSTGPEGGGPLDRPAPTIQILPDHPGEYRWLDSRTLQFLPAVAWPALRRFTVKLENQTHQLVTLMAPPVSLTPTAGSKHLPPLQDVTLGFADRLDPDRLASMIGFEVRPLPGLDETGSQTLTDRDFNIKELERTALGQTVYYQVSLHRAIPHERAVTMTLKLSLDERLPGSLTRYHFSTKPLFRLTGIGDGATELPVSAMGAVYARSQALDGGTEPTGLFLKFSDQPSGVSLAAVKQMLRFEPAVEDLSHELSGNKLMVSFRAQRDRAYKLTVLHAAIRDRGGRKLEPFGETSAWFYFRTLPAYVRWQRSQGIVERYGPQQFPMEARDESRIDLRVYKIDPLDRNFWPFPNFELAVDEQARPAGPGEEPDEATDMVEQVRQLGSPLVSRILDLPETGGGRAGFGLPLAEVLRDISGPEQAGTYLIGYRRIAVDSVRRYIRVQVTDLSLSTVEEESAVTFCVTSLKTGLPVQNARVTVEGLDPSYGKDPQTLVEGVTDRNGWFHYRHGSALSPLVHRIAVRTETDSLVLDPVHPPPQFYDNHWYGSGNRWLGWLNQQPVTEKSRPTRLAHLFAERPVYRPEEPVHLRGYLRLRHEGRLIREPERKRALVVEGPGDKRWTYPVEPDQYGGFYRLFDEPDLATGDYRAWLVDLEDNQRLGFASFKKESYRIPRFEVNLSGPDRAPLDRSFQTVLTADYYAGGRVVDREVTWRVSQTPHSFSTQAYPGFLFSSDERFSEGAPFDPRPLTREDRTDAQGSAALTLDPTLEVDGRPRRYVVEATVTGADEQSVSATRTVLALPPFAIGLKLERFLKDEPVIRPEILVLGVDEQPLAGQELRVRVLHRQWHSYLRESDFTTGKAKYVTDVVDVPVFEEGLVSEDKPLTREYSVTDGGVYVVEIVGRDRLGRQQKVQVDLFLSGDTPISWEKPKDMVFETSWDKTAYRPGETATLLLRSPFQEARALVAVEAPDANRYYWVEVKSGKGEFKLPVRAEMATRMPVHVLLQRGRVPGRESGDTDKAKPATMGATAWLRVEPTDFQIEVGLTHPEKNLPGSAMPLTVTLEDPGGNPLNGEVTLWLVDRAVLALGREGALDPVPSFVQDHRAWIRMCDTRNETIGALPLEEFPGGDGSRKEGADLFGRVTVRRNFQPVPFYRHGIPVVNGRAELEIPLPDNLTDFAVRAVATDGQSRFGFGKSRLSVRLPVIVQSALPRFVRPGDRFTAGGIGRIVEGEGGPGAVQIQVEGLSLEAEPRKTLEWVKDRPETLYFPMEVQTEAASDGQPANRVTIRLAVSRDADGAADAFEIELPVRPDRAWTYREQFAGLSAAEPLALPEPGETPRPGTLSRSVLLTSQPAMIKMLAAMEYLDRYPHGCTEQRISKLMPDLTMKALSAALGRDRDSEALSHDMRETLTFLQQVLTANGLFAFWPGGKGSVSLTAYVVEFLTAARNEGFAFDETLIVRGIAALREALRSDYAHFIEGYRYIERAEALAALAKAGSFDEAYAFELAARAANMDLYGEAKVLATMLAAGLPRDSVVDRLVQDLRQSLIFASRDGETVYQGLQYRTQTWDGPILSSESRTLAGVARALFQLDPDDPNVGILIDALIGLGEGDGWGSTNANAAALETLTTVLSQAPKGEGHTLSLTIGDEERVVDTGGEILTRVETAETGAGELAYVLGPTDALPLAWLRMRYLPEASGDLTVAENHGFVVDRELLVFPEEEGGPPARHAVSAGATVELAMGALVEEHLRLINPEERFYLALTVPFAAGLEPLNPNLATAPAEAKPRGSLTLQPTYAMYGDDQVTFYYDALPKGTFDFYFRLKASIAGSFTHPAARAELMYRQTVFGTSPGARIRIQP